MTIAILIIVNIFMGALLYLIISLKLEKSASEFREKKLRKEMDEIIKEFNATADRNISLLENRITALRRLLERTDSLKGLDLTLSGEEPAGGSDPHIRQDTPGPGTGITGETVDEQPEVSPDFTFKPETGAKSKKSLLIFTKKVMKSIGRKTEEISERISGAISGDNNRENIDFTVDDEKPPEHRVVSSDEYRIEKDLRDIAQPEEPVDGVLQEEPPADELTIDEILSSSEDKYSVISRLYEIGYPAEDIARHSGIPVGEVKLVLNLHNAR